MDFGVVCVQKGFTALHVAAKYGHLEALRLLLEDKRSNVNVAGKNGLTPLHVATHYDNFGVVMMLMQHSADTHAVAKVTPGFQPSVAVSPFRCAVPLCRCDVPLYRCRSSVPWLPLPSRTRTELLETSFRIGRHEVSQPISGDPNADWLSSYGRNGKNKILSYLQRNGNCGRNGSCGGNGTTEFF